MTGVVAALTALYLADAVGLWIPGRGYVRSVLSDPTVFIFVRGLAICVMIALAMLAVWFTLSVLAHIRNHLWVSRPAGFEPQTIHRGAAEVEGGIGALWTVLNETRETNADLLASLDRTNRRVADLEAENAELRRLLGEDQLSFGDGA